MCKCKNIDFGDYSNMGILIVNNKRIQVDKCLVEEIKFLNEKGIETIESCCGHNKNSGYIAVKEKCVSDMINLGYKTKINELYPNAVDFFYPKTSIKDYENIK